jgi:hypothetical protein
MKRPAVLRRIVLLFAALVLITAGTAQAQDSATTPTPVPDRIRYDDPVLRWLPEMAAASAVSGVPIELLAAVMRVESHGDPNIISPAGARGLMQIMPVELAGQGIRQESWHDPATNITAGAWELIERLNGYGSWNGAVGAYFGFGCDVFGTCTDVYIAVVFQWMGYYAWALSDPGAAGLRQLPADWVPPAIAPYMEAAPPIIKTPEPSPTPEPPAQPTATNIPPVATSTPAPIPTEVPTDVPAPTDVPTEVVVEPTEIVVEEPTEVVVEEPTEVIVEEPTEASVESEPVEEPIDTESDAAA